MNRRYICSSLVAVAMLAATLWAADIKLDGVKCIMNPKAAAKAEKNVAYKGGKVFFCCDNCPKGFQKKMKAGDKTVAAKANAQLVATNQAKQAKCPLTGRPLNANQSLTVAGAEVGFCCPNCKGKVAQLKGEKQLLTVLGDAAFKKAGFKVAK